MDNLLASTGWIESPAILPAHVENAVSSIEIAADIFAFISIITGELSMLPNNGKILEFIADYLVIRSIGSLAFRPVDW